MIYNYGEISIKFDGICLIQVSIPFIYRNVVLQTNSCIMTVICAPSFANIFMNHFERKLI